MIIIIILIIIYVSAFVIAVLAQRMIIYPVPSKTNNDCEYKIADQIIQKNNTTLYYQDNNSDEVVVFYHGNADIVCDKADLSEIFNEQQISYIFVEYVGYSGNNGIASDIGIKESVHETINFIADEKYKKVYIIGQSIGTGAAAYHASIVSPDKLLLISPFTTLTEVIQSMFFIYPKFIFEQVFDEQFDNVNLLKDYKNELLIIHGNKDTVVPIEQGRHLLEIISSKNKHFVEIDNYRHGNIHNAKEFEEAVENIVK
jgi:pimeloyl-ACP methyl ester carboxylesterase